MAAYYEATIKELLSLDDSIVIGSLASSQTGTTPAQHVAWEIEVELLKQSFAELARDYAEIINWGILLEFSMLRLHRRIDAVVLADNVIFVIEFKIGASNYDHAARVQAVDYALDLRDFHAGTTGNYVIPILCASEAPDVHTEYPTFTDDVSQVFLTNKSNLGRYLYLINRQVTKKSYIANVTEWSRSAYSPVPSIIDAAEMLYAAHNVEEIHTALADQKNLTTTTNRLIEIIAESQRKNQKVVCFITGVPGSGKTLVGLNAIHDPRFRAQDRESGAFLSGNTPLVAVLREALARDKVTRTKCTKSEALRETKAQIQLLMRYLDHYLDKNPTDVPHENVIVFDEAQRAWDAEYGKQKFNREASEPKLFMEIMARHQDWAVIVALVGGGQEINKGEGGLKEWGDAIHDFNAGVSSRGKWIIYASEHVLEGTAVTAGGVLYPDGSPTDQVIIRDHALHLPVSIRSHRCEVANEWIEAVLEGNAAYAQDLSRRIDDFPVYLTRSANRMLDWLKGTTRGHRRCGLVASSDAKRLRGYGFGVSLSTQELSGITNWFLCERSDIRSSYQLEVTATEYACQGLELDRVGLCWGGDMTWSACQETWVYKRFHGTRWLNVNQDEKRQNLKNTYRVLMSRAREALVVWVPPGDEGDPTRPPNQMNETADYLHSCGINLL